MLTPAAISSLHFLARMVASRDEQFSQSICAQDFSRIVRFQRDDCGFALYQKRGHVSEVQLAVSIGGGDAIDICEQGLGGKGVNAGVDLALFLL